MAIEDTLEALASKPKKVTGDLGSVEMRPSLEAIQLAQWAGNVQAAKTGTAGIGRVWKQIGPGAVSDVVSETQPTGT